MKTIKSQDKKQNAEIIFWEKIMRKTLRRNGRGNEYKNVNNKTEKLQIRSAL